jgi:hypothetical protein
MAWEIHEGDIVLYQGHTWTVMSRNTFRDDPTVHLRLDREVQGAVIGMGAPETDVELVGEQPSLLGDGA